MVLSARDRARAEGVGETCFVGLLQRPERIVLLVLGMFLGWRILELVLGILAIATVGTTVYRLIHVTRKLPAANSSGGRPEGSSSGEPPPPPGPNAEDSP